MSDLDRHPDRGNQPYKLATGWVSETDIFDYVQTRQVIMHALVTCNPPPALQEWAVLVVEELKKAWCPPS